MMDQLALLCAIGESVEVRPFHDERPLPQRVVLAVQVPVWTLYPFTHSA